MATRQPIRIELAEVTPVAPLVSVVVPAIRVDSYLTDAIESLLAQTLSDIEVVLVLDGIGRRGLPDWSLDRRVTVLAVKARQGTPTALNLGISAARGRFIARLDADDVAEATRLSTQVEYLEANPSVLCVGSGAMIIDSSGTELGALDAPTGVARVRTGLTRRNVLTHSSVIFRREAFARVGAYDPSCRRMQDYELFLRIAAIGEIDNLPQKLVRYRVHPGQHSRNSSPWASYTRLVLARRRELAKALGLSGARQFFHDAAWWSAQVARHYGIARPGYIRRSAKAPS